MVFKKKPAEPKLSPEELEYLRRKQLGFQEPAPLKIPEFPPQQQEVAVQEGKCGIFVTGTEEFVYKILQKVVR